MNPTTGISIVGADPRVRPYRGMIHPVAYEPAIHHRRSIRLSKYDYSSPGLYFVTVCVEGKAELLGNIVRAKIVQSAAGRMVETFWRKLPEKFPGVILHEFIVMPNHLHALLGLTRFPDAGRPGRARAPLRRVELPKLARIVQWFKTMSTNAHIRGVRELGWPAVQNRLWRAIITNTSCAHRERPGALPPTS